MAKKYDVSKDNNPHNFANLPKEKLKKLSSKGGKASAAAKKDNRKFSEICDDILKMPISEGEIFKSENADFFNEFAGKNVSVKTALLLMQLKKGLTGDTTAFNVLRDVVGQTLEAEKYENSEKFKNEQNGTNYSGIPAIAVADAFIGVLRDIDDKKHSEYVFPGGRGSTKSAFVSLNVIDLIMKNNDLHACVLRNVGNTLKDSVYSQTMWAISMLGLEKDFTFTKSPLEITRIATGQKIYFRGADDPNKIKSIKPPFGYIGVLWFEELDQFRGEEAVRKIEQSVIRGGDLAYKFKSFNPPKSALNWANKYIKIPRADRLVTESNYLSVPYKWLGKPFIDDAEFLKETNPVAYENEYMGVANGTGGAVFDNVVVRPITDEEISHFDNIYNGVDWGWYPDLYAFCRVQYQPAQHTLYIWQEYTCNKQSNEQTANKLKELGITANDLITCDSAENKSVGDYKAFGLFARAAEKGPNSREYSYKWLQSLSKIIIDNKRCPVAYNEFINAEYDRDRDGNVISGYPDGNDHVIDSVRYATERIWKRRGQ